MSLTPTDGTSIDERKETLTGVIYPHPRDICTETRTRPDQFGP